MIPHPRASISFLYFDSICLLLNNKEGQFDGKPIKLMILNIRLVCVQKFIFSYNYFSCKTNCGYYWAISTQNPQATCFVVVTFSYTFFLDSNKNNKIGFSARKSCSFNHRVTKQSKVSSLEKESYTNIV